jgi:retinoblastoma-like protein 1
MLFTLILVCNTSYKFDGARYYKRVFEEFFVSTDANIENNSSVTTNNVSEYHRFGWLLFLALRVHAFSRFKDLVTCTNGLISILVS